MQTKWTLVALTLVVALLPSRLWAFDFVPTPAEFAAWPHYCKARYVETNIGRTGEFATMVPRAARLSSEAAIGPLTFVHIHHYCAGMSFLARARVEANPQARDQALRRALQESSYTFRHIPPDSLMYSSVAANLAAIEMALGNIDVATQYLTGAKNAKPSDPQPYIGLAILYRDTKRLPLAREVLEEGLRATNEESVEIHYNLGLICFELKDNDCAVRHARVAYAAGYPLPGLKRKLAASGLWQD